MKNVLRVACTITTGTMLATLMAVPQEANAASPPGRCPVAGCETVISGFSQDPTLTIYADNYGDHTGLVTITHKGVLDYQYRIINDPVKSRGAEVYPTTEINLVRRGRSVPQIGASNTVRGIFSQILPTEYEYTRVNARGNGYIEYRAHTDNQGRQIPDRITLQVIGTDQNVRGMTLNRWNNPSATQSALESYIDAVAAFNTAVGQLNTYYLRLLNPLAGMAAAMITMMLMGVGPNYIAAFVAAVIALGLNSAADIRDRTIALQTQYNAMLLRYRRLAVAMNEGDGHVTPVPTIPGVNVDGQTFNRVAHNSFWSYSEPRP